MADQRAQLIRAVTKRLDAFHSASYFSTVVGAALGDAGLSPESQYFASRASVLGAASAELVTATFYSFAPAFVASRVPACWAEASPEATHAARLVGVEAMSAQLFTADEVADRAAEFRAAAERVLAALAPVIAAQELSGRALYAGHRAGLGEEKAQDPALQTFLDLWSAITLLREYRGDGHIAALATAGVTGLEAIVLDSATGKSFRPGAMRRSRGWSEQEWRETAEALARRGLLTGSADSADLTAEGRAFKAEVEDRTNDTVAAAWSAADDRELDWLMDDGKLVAVQVAASGIIPQKLFGHG